MNSHDLHNQTLSSLDLPLVFFFSTRLTHSPLHSSDLFFLGDSGSYVLTPALTLGSLYCCAHGYLTLLPVLSFLRFP